MIWTWIARKAAAVPIIGFGIAGMGAFVGTYDVVSTATRFISGTGAASRTDTSTGVGHAAGACSAISVIAFREMFMLPDVNLPNRSQSHKYIRALTRMST